MPLRVPWFMYLYCLSFLSGAFLIPYLICVIVGGIPLFYLEVAVGQFMGVAGVKAWNLVPIFRGKFRCKLKISSGK